MRLHIAADWKLISEGPVNREILDWRERKQGAPIGTIICFKEKNYEVLDHKRNKLIIRDQDGNSLHWLNKMAPYNTTTPFLLKIFRRLADNFFQKPLF